MAGHQEHPRSGHAPARGGRPNGPNAAARARRRFAVLAIGVLLLAGAGALARFTFRSATGPVCQATASGSTSAFTPEQTENAALITAVALRRGLPARAATIALATALQESDLRNIDYGDRDSVGLFQQRPSQGWGSVAQIMDPIYSAGKFYDELVRVRDYENRPITEVAQEVQRSAYPDAYADHEQQGRVLASALAGHSPGGLACRLADPSGAGDGAELVDELFTQLGHRAGIEGRVLTVHTTSQESAWTVAAWAAAHAEHHEITRITVAGRDWRRDKEPLRWHTASGDADPTTVRIALA